MFRAILAVASFLTVSTAFAAVSNSPFAGSIHIEVDQPANQFTHAKSNGDINWLPFQNQHFFTDTPLLWLASTEGLGSLHTIDFDPVPTYVAIHAGPDLGNGTQEFGYEYVYPGSRMSTSAVLPIAAGLQVVPEPATMGVAVAALLTFWCTARARRRA